MFEIGRPGIVRIHVNAAVPMQRINREARVIHGMNGFRQARVMEMCLRAERQRR